MEEIKLMRHWKQRSCYECNLLSEDLSWKNKKQMFLSRMLPFGFSYQNEIYIFGGYTLTGKFFSQKRNLTCEKCNLLTHTWTRLSSILPRKELYLALAILIFQNGTLLL